MLSVAVHKDVAEYKPKIIGKLTIRTLLSICGAVGSAVLAGLYLNFILGASVTANSFIIYVVSTPFWLIGFWSPKGMKFEEFLSAWIRHKLSHPKIYYVPSMIKMNYIKDNSNKKGKRNIYDKQYRKFIRIRGIECYSPRSGKVETGN